MFHTPNATRFTLPKPLIHYSKYSKSDPSFLFGATDAAQA